MSIQSKSRSRLRTFMLHSSLQPYVTGWPEGLTGSVWGRQFFSKRIWDESQRCQIMISRTSNPYHYTQDPLEPLLPRPAVAWWEVRSERHFVKGSHVTLVQQQGNMVKMPLYYRGPIFINCAYRYGNKKNFSRQSRPFPKGDNKIRSLLCCWRANLVGKDWS